MLRLYQVLLVWMAGVLILSGATLAAMRIIGQNGQPMPETYLDPGEDCPLPCWRGIRPGTRIPITAFTSELHRINLRYTGTPRTIYDESLQDDVLIEFELTMRGDILLSDVFEAMGQPSHATLQYAAGTTSADPNKRQVLVGGTLYFGDGLVQVDVVREDMVWLFSPDMIVRRIRYYSPNPEGSVIPIGTPHWHGFGRNYGQPPR